MDTYPVTQFVFLIILLLLSAVFSSAETALTTVNPIQVQLLLEKGSKSAGRLNWVLEHERRMLSAILIGNNIVNISASALATTITIRLFGNTYVGIATGILTLLVLVFGEIVPKMVATVFALKVSLAYATGVMLLMKLLTPITVLFEKLQDGLLSAMGIDSDTKLNAMTEDELKSLVDVGIEEGAIEDDEYEMITNVFSLDDSLAKDIMIPRIDMVYVPIDASMDELMDIYRKHTYTRYPVYNESRDTVIGTINIKDILMYPENEEFHVGKILREPHFTFEHKEVGTLLIEMRESALSIVIVLDEYGSTAGMITLEDILEEIVGEIRDEFDEDEKDSIVALNNPGEYLIEGSTNLDDVNDELDTHMESEEYDSIGGYFIEHLDRLPKKGESIETEDGIKMIAEIVRRNRVEKVHIILPRVEE